MQKIQLNHFLHQEIPNFMLQIEFRKLCLLIRLYNGVDVIKEEMRC